MRDIMNALLAAAGVTMGFALWVHVKRQSAKPHVHRFDEEVIVQPLDPESVHEVLRELPGEPLSAEYKFLFCECGATTEMIICKFPGPVVTANLVQFTDWQELKLGEN